MIISFKTEELKKKTTFLKLVCCWVSLAQKFNTDKKKISSGIVSWYIFENIQSRHKPVVWQFLKIPFNSIIVYFLCKFSFSAFIFGKFKWSHNIGQYRSYKESLSVSNHFGYRDEFKALPNILDGAYYKDS